MKLKEALSIIHDDTEAADYLSRTPARARRTTKGELETCVRLGWLLYVTGEPEAAGQLIEPLTAVSFENNYDHWTWIEYALVLQVQLSAGAADEEKVRQHAISAVEQAVQTGEESIVQVKQKVHGRFLRGETLHPENIEKAVQDKDDIREANYRLIHLMELSKLAVLGGSAEYPAEQAAREAAEQQARIRQIAEQHGRAELDPFK
ncbi:DUF6707 family protein [Paenibacillus wulumuqiensis]|uniref:DUF6707 family protein n=1 Tax=Paenibacillus wulumuqiensis TaxID=1567107 RepID=UPI000619BBF2|nr:DUF6707 family protein [Paenibacillus wulumuqiensis]